MEWRIDMSSRMRSSALGFDFRSSPALSGQPLGPDQFRCAVRTLLGHSLAGPAQLGREVLQLG
jgi:hypothetical protein